MASSFICDGCGCSVESPQVLGFAIRRDYCEGCKTEAEEFMKAEEELRKGLVDKFTKKRESLIANLSKRGFKLPDVVYEVELTK